MANRDHSLDDGIIQAAYSEFLAYGFQKASLHKIAEKPVSPQERSTQGTKQRRVVCQSASGFFETMQVLFTPVAEEYEKQSAARSRRISSAP